MKDCGCHETVQEHATEIALLKENSNNVLGEMGKSTKAINNLATTLAVYIEKNSTLERDIERNREDLKERSKKQDEQLAKITLRLDKKLDELTVKQTDHGNTLASHQPVIDGARTMNMKVLAGLMGLVLTILVGSYVVINNPNQASTSSN
jgi:predicted outer membrane protein